MKIAIDAMGGDNAPESVVKGALKARDEFSDLELILYGDKTAIEQYITDPTRITIVNTTEVIDMNDEPVRAIRRKKDSSLVVAANAVKAKEADALFSCGNTGALLTAGLLLVGRIKGSRAQACYRHCLLFQGRMEHLTYLIVGLMQIVNQSTFISMLF